MPGELSVTYRPERRSDRGRNGLALAVARRLAGNGRATGTALPRSGVAVLLALALHAAAGWALLGPSPAAPDTVALASQAVIQGDLIRPVPPAPQPMPSATGLARLSPPRPQPARPVPQSLLRANPAANVPALPVAPTAAADPAVQSTGSDSMPSAHESAAAQTGAVIPPRLDASQHHNPAPPYPSRSRRLREEGTVVLELWILPDGRVGEVRVAASSGHARLDAAAREAVHHWRYVAARQGGQPVAWRYRQPVVFSLNP